MGKIVAPESKKKEKYVKFDDPEKETPESAAHRRALKRQEIRKKFVSIDSQFAESNVIFRNYKFHNAHVVYPHVVDVDKRFVSKCYPYAKGGMLLVDEPRNEAEKKWALEKHAKLRELGFRHVIVETYIEEDGKQRLMDIFDLARQLGET